MNLRQTLSFPPIILSIISLLSTIKFELVSFDVVSVFTNIPTDLILHAIKKPMEILNEQNKPFQS